MKGFLSIAATAALLQASSAHYIFSNLIVDGNYTSTYEYVRKNTNNNSPLTDPTSDDFRCNTGAQDSAATTSTYTVAAGATVGMGVGFGGTVIHPGPLLVYLSKAPDGTSASDYDGSGDWFKIHELGTSVINSTGMFWETTDKANFTWTLPADTPPGDYLMRTEHIALHQAETAGGAQYYMECAQLSVTGGGSSATPSPTAKIPGVYTETDPGIEINIYYPIPSSYNFPGPAVWPAGADSSGSSNSTASTGSTGSSAVSSAVSQVSSAAVSAFSHFANATATASTGTKATSLVAVSSEAAATGAGSSSSGSSSSGSSSSGSSSSGSDTGSSGSDSGSAVTSAPAAAAASGNSDASGAQTLYGQCGGEGYTGATACAVGSCVSQNPYYHQCISTEGAAAAATGANKAATSAAAAQITSVAAAEPNAAVATTFVTSKKKCTGGANKAAKSSRPAGTGGIRPSGGALPTGGFAYRSGSLRPSSSGFKRTRTGGLPMVTAE